MAGQRIYWDFDNRQPNGSPRGLTEEEYKKKHGITHKITEEEWNVIRSQQATERTRGESDRTNTAVGDDLSGLYGRATLKTEANIHEASVFASPDGIQGMPLGRGLGWNVEVMQGHGLTFGATRSGKGVSAVIPALLSYSGSMVVIDPKGENAWATAERRRRMGQRVVILDPWGEVHKRYGSKASPPVTEPTTRFNPLSYIDPDSEDFSDEVGAIADALVIPGTGEPHWTDSARELISGLIASQVMLDPGKAHLGLVRKAIASDDDQLAKLVAEIIERDPDSLSARKLQRFGKAAGNKEFISIRSTAETQTAILDSRRLIESMITGEPAFNLDELASSPVTLYLVLPLDRLRTHGRWLRMILTMAIRAIARRDEPPPLPVLFLLDEMGTVGGLTMVEQAFGLMAGVGIRIWGFLQDVNQLKRDYPDSWETFISNSSVIQAMKVSDVSTSDYLSGLLGTTTLERMSAESIRIRQQNPSYKAMADQVHARPILLPQEIRDLPMTKVLNILPGHGTYLIDRMPYFAPDSAWRGLYRSPPRFAAPSPPPAAPSSPIPPTSPPRPASGPFSAISKRKSYFG